jgi:MFS family permease
VDQTSGELARRSQSSFGGLAEPFGYGVFRRVWIASLLSNFGVLIGGVGAAWSMTQLTTHTDMVALVQTATMAPMMLFSLLAGAMADMYDRRRVVIAALLVSFTGATSLTVLGFLQLTTPQLLLALTFLTGCGMALMGPAWQSSVGEQVPQEVLPNAIALNGISYNIARSFGPALGGAIVAAAGSTAAFGANACAYLPMLGVMLLWRRAQEPSRLPPERMGRAVVSGVRYVIHSPRIRVILIRTALVGLIGGVLSALMPVIARDLLGGGAQTFGLMLGSFGVGAVLGALQVGWVRRKLSGESVARGCAVIMAAAIAVVAISRTPYATSPALVAAGCVWTLSVTAFNIGVQMSTPRWVAGRALSTFQTAIAGGIALGGWAWGTVAQRTGVDTALIIASILMLGTAALGLWLKMPQDDVSNAEAEDSLAEPEVNMAITHRSGPIVVELEYRISAEEARTFHSLMQQVQLTRQRNGAYDWSISRDIAEPERWTERFSCPTWLDYLRQRNRATQAEREVQDKARALHMGPEPVRVRRMLERPFGSVRWNEEAPDRGVTVLQPS